MSEKDIILILYSSKELNNYNKVSHEGEGYYFSIGAKGVLARQRVDGTIPIMKSLKNLE